MKDVENMTLENIGSGAAIEKFQASLDVVMANILDPNTDAKKPRKIVITITFQPLPDRDSFYADIDCIEKLAPAAPHRVPGWIGKEKGKPVALHLETPKQESLDMTNVISIKKEA